MKRKFNLFINWFDSPVRPQEFDYCLKKNLLLFDKVFNLNGRPSFTDFFNCAGRFAEDVNVVANLDIYFDQSLKLAQWIDPEEVYCLTRWEDDGIGNIVSFAERNGGHPGEWSQDAWIFTGNSICAVPAPFHLGERGCDNHLAFLLNKHGFKIQNPSLDIKAIHVHNVDRGASMGRGRRVGDNQYLSVKPDKIKML